MNFQCPSCQTELETDADAGQEVDCPQCGETVEVAPRAESIADFFDRIDQSIDQKRPRPAGKTCPMCGVKNRRAAAKCRGCGEPFEADDDQPAALPSPLGIASFLVSLLAAAIIFGAFVFAGYLGVKAGGGEPPQAEIMLVGLAIIGGLMLNIVGVVLGVVALCLPGRSKVFAAIGTAVGALILFGVLFLLGIGIAMQA